MRCCSALKRDSAMMRIHFLNFSVLPSLQKYIILSSAPAGMVGFLLMSLEQ